MGRDDVANLSGRLIFLQSVSVISGLLPHGLQGESEVDY